MRGRVTLSQSLQGCGSIQRHTIVTRANGHRAGKRFIGHRADLTLGIPSGCSDMRQKRCEYASHSKALRAKCLPTRVRFCVSFRSAHSLPAGCGSPRVALARTTDQLNNSMRIIRWSSAMLLMLLRFSSATAQEKSHVTSEQVTRAIQEIEKLARKQIQENALPGLAIAVVFQGKAVYAKGFGVRDVNTKVPVDADTVFQLASLSKPIGSTLVAELV